MTTTINVDAFVQSYLATASWVTCDSDENFEFTKAAKVTAKNDCIKFMDAVAERLGNEAAENLLSIEGKDLQYLAAHDFFLTRNGHGAGFFDKTDKYGKAHADILTEIAQAQGSADCYHVRGKKSKLTF